MAPLQLGILVGKPVYHVRPLRSLPNKFQTSAAHLPCLRLQLAPQPVALVQQRHVGGVLKVALAAWPTGV